jgi:protein-disulfide isomerase/uncharacterized membrane protein
LRKPAWLFLLRLSSLLGLSVSVMVLLDYSSPEMAFCSGASGCGAVRDSGFGFVVLPSGQPLPYLPMLGVVHFAALLAGSLFASARTRRLVAGTLALAGGPVGLGLLLVQAFIIGHFCSLCLVVDGAALLIFVAGLMLRGTGWDEATRIEQGQAGELRPLDLCVGPLGWLGAVALSIAGPLAFTSLARTTELPSAISALHEPGKATVVEFFDYQCPHCRVALPELDRAVAEFRLPVRVIRQPLALPGRELGRRAARLHICAAEQEQEDQMLRVLISGPELTEQHLARALQLPGIDQEKLVSCLESKVPDRGLAVALERIQSAGFVGLPTVYVGHTRILGSASAEVYAKALESAATGRDTRGMAPTLYWLQVGLLVLFVLWLGRVRKPKMGRSDESGPATADPADAHAQKASADSASVDVATSD